MVRIGQGFFPEAKKKKILEHFQKLSVDETTVLPTVCKSTREDVFNNSYTPTIDLERISSYNIDIISSRQLLRVRENIC